MFCQLRLICSLFLFLHLTLPISGIPCYGCLEEKPVFDYKNNVKSKFPSCFLHTNLSCPATKCSISLRKLSVGVAEIEKDCSHSSDPTQCTDLDGGAQKCICEKRYCNADIEVAGGKRIDGILEVKTSGGGGRIRLSGWILICSLIVATFVFLNCIDYSHQLICCSGQTKIKESDEGVHCIEEGTKCDNVGCKEDPCQVQGCPENRTCPTTGNWVCRLLYYELITGKEDEAGEITLQDDYYIDQDCFDMSSDDGAGLQLGCEFYRKVFYLDPRTRVTHRKDCYCNSFRCNYDLPGACNSNNPGTNTCQSHAAPRYANKGTFVSALQLLLSVMISTYFIPKL